MERKAILLIFLALLQLIIIFFMELSYYCSGLEAGNPSSLNGLFSFAAIAIAAVAAITIISYILAAIEKDNQLVIQQEKLANSEELLHTMRMQRHDFNNHLLVVRGLMEVGAYEEARVYMGEATGPIRATNKLLSDNNAVTALLQAKVNLAQKKGVNAHIRVHGSLKEPVIPASEVNTILGNLLDNAIEALETCGGKKNIHVVIQSNPEALSIGVSNSCIIPEECRESILKPGFTTKETGQGMGLYSIKCIIERYGGNLEITTGNEYTEFIISFLRKSPLSEFH